MRVKHLTDLQIQEYISGLRDKTKHSNSLIHDHLAICTTCSDQVNEYGDLITLVEKQAPPELSNDFETKILSRIAPHPLSVIGGSKKALAAFFILFAATSLYAILDLVTFMNASTLSFGILFNIIEYRFDLLLSGLLTSIPEIPSLPFEHNIRSFTQTHIQVITLALIVACTAMFYSCLDICLLTDKYRRDYRDLGN